MKKLLPVLLALIGIGGGVGAGLALRPAPEPMSEEMVEAESAEQEKEAMDGGEATGDEPADGSKSYVKLNNQFVVPVIADEKVSALVVLSLSVEVAAGDVQDVFSREPKLRDAYLQVLFDHANVGGFDGAFTNSNTMDVLRRALLEASFHAVGEMISDVLITEIARQDA